MARHDYDSETSINITPLIDILFILLLFFILTSTFDLENERSIDITLPQTQTDQVIETPEIFRITVDADSNLFLESEEITIEQLTASAERKHKSSGEFITVISADEKASHGVVMKVLDTLRLSGISNINIQVR
ncbi:MAG TPA: biopolymer transporter ExbD [Thermotogota bacterium]|nr:biopolymer transporter ExbD [Thermotogota bacterium]HRW34387.1 biopolymer transporter ExbD [Thermotogota bacterium]